MGPQAAPTAAGPDQQRQQMFEAIITAMMQDPGLAQMVAQALTQAAQQAQQQQQAQQAQAGAQMYGGPVGAV
jgi:hypothetical protein